MRSFGSVLGASLSLGLCLATGSAWAVDWDQSKVTSLVTQLHSEIKLLRADPGLSPQQDTAFQERRHAAALRVLESMQRDVGRLASMLREGVGRDSTQSVFDGLEDELAEIRSLAEESWVKPSAREKIRLVRRTYGMLEAFYGTPR
jgi:hypothetical protein